MVVEALEHQRDLLPLLVHARERVDEVRLVERAMLRDEGPHEPASDARAARVALPARLAAAIVGEDLRDAPAGHAPCGGAEPEVPVLGALDETGVVAADRTPDLAPEQRGDVDRAADQQVLDRELTRPPHAMVPADEPDPRER